MHILRLSVLNCAVAVALKLTSSLAAAECTGISASVQPRLIIPLFRYAGSTESVASNNFSLFQAVITTKLNALVGEVQQRVSMQGDASTSNGATDIGLGYLRALQLYIPQDGPIPDSLNTPEKLETYWRKQNALQLLRGELWSGKPYFVDSHIFVGDLRGDFPSTVINVRLAIRPELIGNNNDSHSLVTYYALAMDAKRLKCDPAIVRNLLSRAWSVMQDLNRREGGMVGDMIELERSLKHELNPSP